MARGDVAFPPGLPLSTQVVQRAKHWEAYVISTSLDMPQTLYRHRKWKCKNEREALTWISHQITSWKADKEKSDEQGRWRTALL